MFAFARRILPVVGGSPAVTLLVGIGQLLTGAVPDLPLRGVVLLDELERKLQAVKTPERTLLQTAYAERGVLPIPHQVLVLEDSAFSDFCGFVMRLQQLRRDGRVVLAQQTIGDLFGTSRRTVGRWIKRLAGLGLLELLQAAETGLAAEYRWLPVVESRPAEEQIQYVEPVRTGVGVAEAEPLRDRIPRSEMGSLPGGDQGCVSGDSGRVVGGGAREAGSVPSVKADRAHSAPDVVRVATTTPQDRACDPPVVRADRVPPGPRQGPAGGIEQEVLQAWNAIAGFQRARSLTPERRRLIRNRARDPFWRDHWRQALEFAARDRFLSGENDRGWRATLDWFLRESTVLQLIERRESGSCDRRSVVRDCGTLVRSDAFREQVAREMSGTTC